jgi:hypothetical protein
MNSPKFDNMPVYQYFKGLHGTPARMHHSLKYVYGMILHTTTPANSNYNHRVLDIGLMDDFGNYASVVPFKDQFNYSMQGCKYEI